MIIFMIAGYMAGPHLHQVQLTKQNVTSIILLPDGNAGTRLPLRAARRLKVFVFIRIHTLKRLNLAAINYMVKKIRLI